MARAINRELVGKDENGRYTDEFKQKIIKCIENGMNSNEAAKKLGVEPLGSGYRQLYYKLQREYKLGESLPTMHAKGLNKDEKNTADSGIKNEGAVLDSKEKSSRQIITEQVSGDIRRTAVEHSGKKEISHNSDKNNTSIDKANENVFSKSQKNLEQDKTNVQTVSTKVNNKEVSSNVKKDLVQDKADTSTEPTAKVGGGMSYEDKKKSFASTEVSSELMDDIVDRYKESISQGKGVDYLLGSIDSKIESLEDEILDKKKTIDFLRFLRTELSNKEAK